MLDVAGAIAELNGIDQIFHYDAYGQAIGFVPSQAATEFLYSGEQFDAKIGQQYLRARYYDPATGRFNRLDPFFGNATDPQSLHNYLYCHADPVNGTDPNGEMTVMVAIGIGALAGGLVGATAGAFYGWYNHGTWDGSWSNIGYNAFIWGAAGTLAAIPVLIGSLTTPAIGLASGAFILVPIVESLFYYGPTRFLNSDERKVVEEAEKIIKSNVVFYNYYAWSYGVYPEYSLTTPYAMAPKTSWYTLNKTIWFNEKTLKLPPELLALAIVHEATHNRQLFLVSGTPGAETYAYYCEALFAKLIGVKGSVAALTDHYKQKGYDEDLVRDYLGEQAIRFEEYGIDDPPITTY